MSGTYLVERTDFLSPSVTLKIDKRNLMNDESFLRACRHLRHIWFDYTPHPTITQATLVNWDKKALER